MPSPILSCRAPQAHRLDSKTGSGTKQASLVADDTAELPVTTISVVSLLGLYSRVAHVCVCETGKTSSDEASTSGR